MSDEEGTASGAPVDVVKQAIETIRRVVDEYQEGLVEQRRLRDELREARQDVAEARAERDQVRAESVQLRSLHLPVRVAGLTRERELDELRATLAQVRRDNRQAVEANDRLRRERDAWKEDVERIHGIALAEPTGGDYERVRRERDEAREQRNQCNSALAKLQAERAAILEILQ